MKYLITSIIIFGLVIALSQYSYGAKTYTKKTADNSVKRIGEVQVEESDPTPTKTIYTLDYLNTRRSTLVGTITSNQAELARIEALIIIITLEAEKVILNTDP